MSEDFLDMSSTAEFRAVTHDSIDEARVRGLEDTLRRRDAVLSAVCYATSRFLNTEDWNADLRELLARLGTAAGVGRVSLFEARRDDEGRMHRVTVHEWSRPGTSLPSPLEANHVLAASPSEAEVPASGRCRIIHRSLKAVPPDEQGFFEGLDAHSFGAVPVFAGGSWWGYLAWSDDLASRVWSSSVLEALEAAAATIGATIYRKNAEEGLRASEERFRLLAEAAIEGVLIHIDGLIMEANETLAKMFGLTVDDLIGKNAFDVLIVPEARDFVREQLRLGIESSYVIPGRTPNGARLFEITARRTTYRGRPARVVAVLDITERRRAEEERRQRDRELAEAQAVAHMGSFVWDIETNDLRGSDELFRIFGLDPREHHAASALLERIHPDDAALVRETIDRAVAEGGEYSVEHRIVRGPGDIRVHRTDGRVVLNADGTAKQLIGVGQDVTEARQAEATARQLIEEHAAREAAEHAERRAAFLAEGSRVLGSSFDYQTTLASLTRLAVPTLADYCTVDIIGRDEKIERVGVAHADPMKEPVLWAVTKYVRTDLPMAPHLHRALVEGESTLVAEYDDEQLAATLLDDEHLRLVRRLSPRSIVSVPLQLGGRILGVLALYMSESGRRFGPDDLSLAEELGRRASLAIENARLFSEAEKATKARDHMLGIVAHDLRNPLGTILMASELLAETLAEGTVARKQVAIVQRAGERMKRLIKDLLDIKRIENGRLAVEPRPMPSLAMLNEAAETLRPLAAANGLELVLDAPDDLPLVGADPHRMQQVLSNLVGNAIKFTPRQGKIFVRGRREGSEVRVAVEDTGPGIPTEQLPHIFGQFWQGGRDDKRGIGLGLSIAKGIVDAHGGRIWVESTLGAGSSFYFTLPVSTGVVSSRWSSSIAPGMLVQH
jgi:PAS domain S-box-containing protein